MPRTCTVCAHPERRAIDTALAKGEASNRRIAAQYGLGERAVRDHKAHHLAARLVRAQDAAEVADADDLLRQLRALRNKAFTLLSKAEDAGDLRTALAGIREARNTIELLLEVEGELQRRGTVNILVAPEWLEVRAALITSLAPFPAARQAVADALARLEAS